MGAAASYKSVKDGCKVGNPSGLFIKIPETTGTLTRAQPSREDWENKALAGPDAIGMLASLSSECVLSKTEMSYAWRGGGGEAKDWEGTYVDVFSPDYNKEERTPWDTNPNSRRFVDMIGEKLCISGDHATGQADARWGKRFLSTSQSPVLVPSDETGGKCTVSFLCKVPEDAPIYADAKNGAFEFIVELGVIHGRKTLKWSTIYQGKGGKIGANEFPADDAAENFWVCVDGKPIDINED